MQFTKITSYNNLSLHIIISNDNYYYRGTTTTTTRPSSSTTTSATSQTQMMPTIYIVSDGQNAKYHTQKCKHIRKRHDIKVYDHCLTCGACSREDTKNK